MRQVPNILNTLFLDIEIRNIGMLPKFLNISNNEISIWLDKVPSGTTKMSGQKGYVVEYNESKFASMTE